MTLARMRQIVHCRTIIEVDEAMLRQIQRIVPASVAGCSEWTGTLGEDEPPVWVRWHWYFDEVRHDFVIPAHGFSSNILLTSPTGIPLSLSTLFRAAMRRILRRQDWQPAMRTLVRRPVARPPPRDTLPRAAIQSPPIAPRPPHLDGTTAWSERVVRDLMLLPEAEQFGQLAKLARVKFGFDQTLALARLPGTEDFVIDENHAPAWGEVYAREQLVLIDPRLRITGAPQCWSIGEAHMQVPGFWEHAARHGAASGWAMASADGAAILVLSRSTPPPSPSELAKMEPNLIGLGKFAHELMVGRLHAAAVGADADGTALPAGAREILAHLDTGKFNKEIAHLLKMSESTLYRKIRAIKSALGAKTTLAAISEARRQGLLQA